MVQRTAGATPPQVNEAAITKMLARGVGAPAKDMEGYWKVEGNEFVSGFTARRAKSACASKCCYQACRWFEGKVVGTVEVRLRDMTWRGEKPWWIKDRREDAGYHLVIHANGVITFVPLSGGNLGETLALARLDSQSHTQFLLNVMHALRFGCFCFAVLQRNAKAQLFFRRYNRWAGALVPFYKATHEKRKT